MFAALVLSQQISAVPNQAAAGAGEPVAASADSVGAGVAPQQGGAVRGVASGGAAGDVTYHGGQVQRSQKVFTIFWNPGAPFPAGYQAAIVRQLVERAAGALEATGRSELAVVGGVAANAALREALAEACAERGARLSLLPPALCVDNAAMIGAAAFAAPALEPSEYLALDAYARSPLAG